MDTQRIARTVGWLFIATFVTGIGARLLFVDGLGGTWSDLGFSVGAGSDTSMYFAAILEFGVIAPTSRPRCSCIRSSSDRARSARSGTSRHA